MNQLINKRIILTNTGTIIYRLSALVNFNLNMNQMVLEPEPNKLTVQLFQCKPVTNSPKFASYQQNVYFITLHSTLKKQSNSSSKVATYQKRRLYNVYTSYQINIEQPNIQKQQEGGRMPAASRPTTSGRRKKAGKLRITRSARQTRTAQKVNMTTRSTEFAAGGS